VGTIEKIEQIKELLDCLAEGIKDIHKKDFLETAMHIHIKRITAAPDDLIAKQVKLFFENKKRKATLQK